MGKTLQDTNCQEKHLVVLTGAGISAESGLKTFRDSDGLWEKYNVYELATPEAWEKHPEKVLEFYNERRKQLLNVKPNKAHIILAKLEQHFNKVTIITQNVDDLHERAGSTNILHLHGELRKARSTCDESKVYPIKGAELNMGDTDENGCQLRPHVVWFGEPVPMLPKAVEMTKQADIFLIIGTSLIVYPAASLISYLPDKTPIYYIDPNPAQIYNPNLTTLSLIASEGLEKWLKTINIEL